jgi:hypothetical protein
MRRIMLLVVAALVMAALMAAMAVPAFAAQPEGPVGGGGGMCTDDLTSCQGGYGTAAPGNPGSNGFPVGGGYHGTLDPATGDETFSTGSGGYNSAYDEPSGAGVHCEGNAYTLEYDCVGTGYSGGGQ